MQSQVLTMRWWWINHIYLDPGQIVVEASIYGSHCKYNIFCLFVGLNVLAG